MLFSSFQMPTRGFDLPDSCSTYDQINVRWKFGQDQINVYRKFGRILKKAFLQIENVYIRKCRNGQTDGW